MAVLRPSGNVSLGPCAIPNIRLSRASTIVLPCRSGCGNGRGVRVKGTVTRIEQARQRGEVRGEDGQLHRFERDGMVLEWQFNDLQPGTPLTFDLERTSRATNVRRVK